MAERARASVLNGIMMGGWGGGGGDAASPFFPNLFSSPLLTQGRGGRKGELVCVCGEGHACREPCFACVFLAFEGGVRACGRVRAGEAGGGLAPEVVSSLFFLAPPRPTPHPPKRHGQKIQGRPKARPSGRHRRPGPHAAAAAAAAAPGTPGRRRTPAFKKTKDERRRRCRLRSAQRGRPAARAPGQPPCYGRPRPGGVGVCAQGRCSLCDVEVRNPGSAPQNAGARTHCARCVVCARAPAASETASPLCAL